MYLNLDNLCKLEVLIEFMTEFSLYGTRTPFTTNISS